MLEIIKISKIKGVDIDQKKILFFDKKNNKESKNYLNYK